jgi:monofunctional chorismate mutase
MNELREQINAVDNQLLDLFERRMAIARQIGEYKRGNSLPVLNSEREEQILSRLGARCKPELSEYVQKLFTALFELSRDYQNDCQNDYQNDCIKEKEQ